MNPAAAAAAAVLLGTLLPVAALAADERHAPPSAPTLAASMRGEVPALQLAVAPRARLFYEPKPELPWQAASPLAPPPEHRLGLEFRSGESHSPRHLLRLQMSATSALHFRPRGGGLAVSWRSQF